MTHLASNWINCSVESSRWGSAHMSIVPYQVETLLSALISSSQTFPTSDGFLTIGCGNNNQFAELCLRMGEADLAGEEKYASNESRVENRLELIGKLSKVLSSKTNSQWCEAFKGVSFPYGPVNKMSEVFEEPQVQQSSRTFVTGSQHPGSAPGAPPKDCPSWSWPGGVPGGTSRQLLGI